MNPLVLRMVIALGLFALGCAAGWNVRDGRAAKVELRTVTRTIEVERKRDAVSAEVGAKAAKAVERERVVTRTLIQKVPVYVAPETDRRFPLPVGFVRVHDAAVSGAEPLPDPAGRADGSASDVAASEAAGVVAANYGDCRADQAKLSALQDWNRRQGEVKP